jgi:hypothetical protein
MVDGGHLCVVDSNLNSTTTPDHRLAFTIWPIAFANSVTQDIRRISMSDSAVLTPGVWIGQFTRMASRMNSTFHRPKTKNTVIDA